MLKTLELHGMTSCVLQTWCRMVFLWNFNQPVCDLVHNGQSVVESTSLQGFPSEIRHHRGRRYRDGRFSALKGNVLHKSSCSALSHFQLIDIFLLMWVPDAGTVFQLGTDDSFVSLFLQVLRTPIQSTSEKAQHAVCGSADLINVLVPAKSAVHCDSQIDTCVNGVERLIIHGVLVVDLVFCSVSDGDNIALLYVKYHPPCLTPLDECIKVFLHKVAVRWRPDFTIYQTTNHQQRDGSVKTHFLLYR